ncbi:hypothetical protein [Cohaesibacter gelatinilyticus]|uniref:Permuted papain-like amidase enzyme, YaeF/YiiX, C92 family n=1 Tax=Cohaesibacter gelatinilyticus TaxID=372072 RepID=A0A285PIQ8_9HYPH|nr:hypothetical protein [Cohaesibacter gelatinilyticus]SNZ21620.1 hypothetical protein SAMN06265368_4744 [Cohaesibacter gelatinilyticus]HAT85828.1 hypothetical protein [Hyphomicrobiales bacterium]
MSDGITFAFYKAKGGWQNAVVRLGTQSRYSHCEAIFVHAEIGDTVMCHSSSSMDGGARSKVITLRDDFWDLVHLPRCFFDEAHAHAFLERTKGTYYDYPGILLSHIFSLNRHSETRWFCSEFCAELIKVPNPHTYSPQAFYDLVCYLRDRFERHDAHIKCQGG